MREPPELADAAIITALQSHFGIIVKTLVFLLLGDDSSSFAYCAEATDGVTYFAKLRSEYGFSVSSLAVPQFLHTQGVPHVLAPLLTISQSLWVNVEGYALSLYPFIVGGQATDVGLTERQWGELGATMRIVHATALTPGLVRNLGIRSETYIPSRRNVIADIQAVISRSDLSTPAESDLAAFWHAKSDIIDTVVARADSLARQLRQAAPGPLVLCHADLHTWNVLVDGDGQIWIVDWDETILAPKERDLIFVVGGIGTNLVRPHETDYFLQEYGDGAINSTALAYYRFAWAVQDLAAYGEQVFFMPGLSEHARREAVRGIMSLFEPGNIVDIAFASQG